MENQGTKAYYTINGHCKLKWFWEFESAVWKDIFFCKIGIEFQFFSEAPFTFLTWSQGWQPRHQFVWIHVFFLLWHLFAPLSWELAILVISVFMVPSLWPLCSSVLDGSNQRLGDPSAAASSECPRVLFFYLHVPVRCLVSCLFFLDSGKFENILLSIHACPWTSHGEMI